MNKKVLVIVQGRNSNPGRIGRELRRMGYTLDVRQPSGGGLLPGTMRDHDAAVIFGGPMSANDDGRYDFIHSQISWIPVVLESGKPFLGICLGAQMLARTLGARVNFHPERRVEIGYHPVNPTKEGKAFIDKTHLVYQWHSEGFNLPDGAVHLARSDTFEYQAFRYGNAFGIQFHPEVTGKIMGNWATYAAHRLSEPGAQNKNDQLRLRPRSERQVRGWLRRFMPTWLAPLDSNTRLNSTQSPTSQRQYAAD